MINSNELCHPLSLPFACFNIVSPDNYAGKELYSHYYMELHLLRRGSLRLLLEGEEMLLQPGDAAVICPEVSHRAMEASEPLCVTVIRVDPARLAPMPDYSVGLSDILMEAARIGMPMKIPKAEAEEMRLAQLCDTCLQELAERPFGFDYAISSALGLVCMQLVRFWLSRGLALPGRDTRVDPIYSLSGYIQTHLEDGLRVEDLAVRCGLSYPWFAKKFREVYGISCKDYIEQIRVSRVEHYLRFTGMDLAQISKATGYADCSHMIKNFKRIMGITPGQFRLKQGKS